MPPGCLFVACFGSLYALCTSALSAQRWKEGALKKCWSLATSSGVTVGRRLSMRTVTNCHLHEKFIHQSQSNMETMGKLHFLACRSNRAMKALTSPSSTRIPLLMRCARTMGCHGLSRPSPLPRLMALAVRSDAPSGLPCARSSRSRRMPSARNSADRVCPKAPCMSWLPKSWSPHSPVTTTLLERSTASDTARSSSMASHTSTSVHARPGP
mmetsp:Transcript_6712/g.22604  ORF Transcript_6712/g.22604 Transcript_6712/m.22604 type:complete len:212 (+) Transcript_6712:421-1056(+)